MELVYHLSYAQIEENYGINESTRRERGQKWIQRYGKKKKLLKKKQTTLVLEELYKKLKGFYR